MGEIQHKGNINEHICVCVCVGGGGGVDEKEDGERERREGRTRRKGGSEGGSKGLPYFLGTQSSPNVNLDSCTIR